MARRGGFFRDLRLGLVEAGIGWDCGQVPVFGVAGLERRFQEGNGHGPRVFSASFARAVDGNAVGGAVTGAISGKGRLPLRTGEAAGAGRRADPRLGMAVTPWRLARTLSARCPVLLGGDYPLVLAGLRAVLAGEPGLGVAGEVAGAVAALRDGALADGVLVLASAGWGGAHAEALAGLRARAPGVRVVLLTEEADESRLDQFRLGGGRTVVRLSAPLEEVLVAVRAARPVRASDWEAPETTLSEREALVLRRKANGQANKAIAAELGISVKTVETYYTRAMEKLGLRGRAEMLRFGVAQGWVGNGL